MLQAGAEAVQPPADDHVEAPAPGVTQQLVQSRTPINGATDAPVNKLLR